LTDLPSAAPAPDEVEFSAFGPGYGECLLVHLGGGEWMVVDSCIREGRHPVLDYLRRLEVDVTTAVKLIVATHWHDDHVRGMAELVTACPSAAFVCSDALRFDELVGTFASLPEPPTQGVSSGVREMKRTFDVVTGRRGPAKWAVQDRFLYERSTTEALPISCHVRALSPSDEAVTRSYRTIAALLGAADRDSDGGRRFRRVGRPERNESAVVMSVDIGVAPPGEHTCMVLGADLQEDPRHGWAAVVAAWHGRGRCAEVFKVPHHGSENGHSDDVWTSMLTEEPEVVVCPHVNGRTRIPTPVDIDRLCSLSRNVHITAQGWREPVRRSGKVLDPPGPFGQVTLRRRLLPDASWAPGYSEAAGPACAPPATDAD
jgi:hypothetical protein